MAAAGPRRIRENGPDVIEQVRPQVVPYGKLLEEDVIKLPALSCKQDNALAR